MALIIICKSTYFILFLQTNWDKTAIFFKITKNYSFIPYLITSIKKES